MTKDTKDYLLDLVFREIRRCDNEIKSHDKWIEYYVNTPPNMPHSEISECINSHLSSSIRYSDKKIFLENIYKELGDYYE